MTILASKMFFAAAIGVTAAAKELGLDVKLSDIAKSDNASSVALIGATMRAIMASALGETIDLIDDISVKSKQ
jgi:hypothetical protein